MTTDEQLRADREWLESSDIGAVFPELKRGLWHTTSAEGYAGIRRTGAIKPNDGSRTFTYKQTENSFGYLKGYVSLFDFETASEDQCYGHWFAWQAFFVRPRVVIEIARDQVLEGLVPNERAREEVGYTRMWIPNVEAWHDGPIPVSATRRYLFLPGPERISQEPFFIDRDDARHEELMKSGW